MLEEFTKEIVAILNAKADVLMGLGGSHSQTTPSQQSLEGFVTPHSDTKSHFAGGDDDEDPEEVLTRSIRSKQAQSAQRRQEKAASLQESAKKVKSETTALLEMIQNPAAFMEAIEKAEAEEEAKKQESSVTVSVSVDTTTEPTRMGLSEWVNSPQ